VSGLVVSRRGLVISGAASAGGALVGACGSARPDAAHAPWLTWNDPALAGTPQALAAAAILAANPHDTQPWLFGLSGEAIAVYADTARNLGAMDPMLREMHIGLGCAIENLCLAAAPNGYATRVEPVPGSLLDIGERKGPVLAATVHLSRLSTPGRPEPCYGAIPRRHTNRNPYDRARGLPGHWRALAELNADARVRLFTFETGRLREAHDAAVVEATGSIIADHAMIADSDHWLRSTPAQIERYRSGPTLETAGLSPLTRLMAQTLPLSASFKHEAWLDQTREAQVATAPMTGLIAVRDLYDRPSALAAGRLWQRIHLNATLAGVALQPLNQPMEMVDRERQLKQGSAWSDRMAALVGAAGWRPTFSFRAGMAPRPADASPRRALADAIRAG
jgi:hypothetical protein